MVRFVKGKIKIVSIPAGEAPLHIRKKWLGLKLPVCFIHNEGGATGVLTGQAVPNEGIVYSVVQTDAIEVPLVTPQVGHSTLLMNNTPTAF